MVTKNNLAPTDYQPVPVPKPRSGGETSFFYLPEKKWVGTPRSRRGVIEISRAITEYFEYFYPNEVNVLTPEEVKKLNDVVYNIDSNFPAPIEGITLTMGGRKLLDTAQNWSWRLLDYQKNNKEDEDFDKEFSRLFLDVLSKDVKINVRRIIDETLTSEPFDYTKAEARTASPYLNDEKPLLVAAEAKEVGAMFERAREDKGISKKAMERDHGIARAAVQQFERGANSPTLERVQKYAEALGFEARIELVPKDKS